jgi:demethylmenaquinone methyltransferase/2-methoxy-6-polyprenyl-1,4-benzoquinol methylase
MLIAGREKARIANVQAKSERLPFADASFDLVTIGFALRHFADLDGVFAECARVLRPGGKLLILEITAPRSAAGRVMLGAYMGGIVPPIASLLTWRRDVGKMLRYYWATTRDCVPPDVILSAMQRAGFRDTDRTVSIGIFSEYSGVTAASVIPSGVDSEESADSAQAIARALRRSG